MSYVYRCSGYHHAHRPGSRCCEANPAHAYWRAKREGADDETLLALSLASPGKVLRGRCLVPF